MLVVVSSYSFGLFSPLDSALFLICMSGQYSAEDLRSFGRHPVLSLCVALSSQYSVLYTTLQAPLPKPRKTSELCWFPLLWPGIQTLFRQKLMAVVSSSLSVSAKSKFLSYLARSRSLHFFLNCLFIYVTVAGDSVVCAEIRAFRVRKIKETIFSSSSQLLDNSSISINMKINKCSMQVSIKDKKIIAFLSNSSSLILIVTCLLQWIIL